MRNRKPKHLVLGGAVLLCLSAIGLSASGYEAKDSTESVCHAEITVSATQKPKSKAMNMAISSWEDVAAIKHGAEYGIWSAAGKKAKRCTAVAGGFGNKTYTCVVSAMPCPSADN